MISDSDFLALKRIVYELQAKLRLIGFGDVMDALDSKTDETDFQAHLTDTTDAHDASAISNVPAGSISSIDVQAAVNELDTDITNHLADATDAHDASAISNVPAGNIVAVNVQTAVNELDTEKLATGGHTIQKILVVDASGNIVKATYGFYDDTLHAFILGDAAAIAAGTQFGIFQQPNAEDISPPHVFWAWQSGATKRRGFIKGFKAHGTKASPTALIAGESLFEFLFAGHDGVTNFTGSMAGIFFVAASAWRPTTDPSGVNYATEIQFHGCKPDTSTLVNQATLEANGNFNIETPGATYDVNGIPHTHAASGDLVSTLTSAEISITGAGALTISRFHVISGTSYTVTLPAASGNAGKFIGGRITATGIITVDGNASETIDTVTTKRYFQNQSFLLLCDGSNWFDVLVATAPRSAETFLDGAICSTAITKLLDLNQRYTLFFYPTAPADGVTLEFPIFISAGSYTCTVLGITQSSAGKFDWTLNGVSQTTGQDWYSGGVVYNVEKTFTVTVPYSGYHLLKATVNGKNVASTNYYFVFTKVILTPAVY